MATMYRQKVTIGDGSPIRANVYVLSQAQSYAKGGNLKETVISVTLPPRRGPEIKSAERVTYEGETFRVQGYPVPIHALGRLDHWEITGLKVTG